MRRLWLIFAQTVTVSLAVIFVLHTVKPGWLDFSSVGQSSVHTTQAGVPAEPSPAAANASFSTAAKKALPSVVYVSTSQRLSAPPHPALDDPLFRHFFGDRPDTDEPRNPGLGSGVIVSPSGYILTNFHVVDGADQIEVALNDGRKLNARLVGGDPETDLAVLQVDAGETGTNGEPPMSPVSPMPAITLGEMETLAIGDVVLAIGNPFGVGQTVTMGIVSALGRSHLGINTFENFIQTDAAINPGNSGGALIDTQGRLLGINTAIYSRSGGSLGIGFAIPVSTAKSIMEEIIQTGSVTRGWIGIEAQEITPELAESFDLQNTDGALIAGVQRGSPADTGGVKLGDILLAVAGKPIKDPQAMLDVIASQKPGAPTPFTLRRNKKAFDTTIVIGKRPAMPRAPE